MNMLTEIILETEITSLITKVTEKVLQSGAKNLSPSVGKNLNVSDDVRKLLENSVKEIKKNDYFSGLDYNEFRVLLENNLEILSSWIFNPYPVNFHSDDLIVCPADSKERVDVLKGIYEYIKRHKNEYLSIGFQNLTNQIGTSTNIVRNDIANVQNDTYAIKTMLESFISNQKTKSTNELQNIQNLIKKREYKKAEILLQSLSEKVLTTGTDEDKEEFYLACVNLDLNYIPDNKDKLFSDITCLIEFTNDDKLKKYRKTIKLIYEEKFEDALIQISENIDDAKIMYSELKAHIYFATKKYEELLDFVKTFDDKEKVLWQLRTYLNTQKFELGFKLLNSDCLLNNTDFETKVLRSQIITYYILNEFNSDNNEELLIIAEELLKDIDEILKVANDDSFAKGELITSKMLLNLAIGSADYDDILPYIIELDSLNCRNPNYLKNKGIYYLSNGNYKMAFEILDEWCNQYPDAILTKELRAIAYIGYDAEKARKEFSVLPDSIENLPLKIKIFDSYMRDYHFDEAYEFLKNLDSNYEESSYILNAYGDYYCAIQNYEEAYKYFIRAINCNDPNISKIDIFAKALRIAISCNNSSKLTECAKYNSLFQNKDALHCYCGEIVTMFIMLQNFDKALAIIDLYKKYSFTYNSLINYWEILCLFNMQHFEKVIKIYNDDNSGILERRDVNQKYKAYIISAINTKINLTKAKSMYKLLLPPESEIETLEREWMLSKITNNAFEYISRCLEDLKLYPDSVQIMENFLVACLDYGLQNLSSQQEISTAFAEFSKKFMNAPNEKKTGRIGFFKF